VRPIGADVTVVSAIGHNINVSAQVILNPSTNAGIVNEAFESAMQTYLESIAFVDYLVVYNRIGYILLNIPGVINYTSLTVNGGTVDIVIGDDEVPVIGNIEVTG